jgi:alkylhydroperoxidase/carboxymuconolactone decarboxylase family protein YurZ
VGRHEDILRKLAIRDDLFVESILADEERNLAESCLDPKTHALVRIGALIGIDAATAAFAWSTDAGLRDGATLEEVVGTLVAVIPAVGTGRVVAAAPRLGLAVGYDVWGALEQRHSLGSGH